jgi:hypothetical protein
MKLALSVILCFGLTASAALVPFYDNAQFPGHNYTREEQVNPPWWVHNNWSPSILYDHGVFVSQEEGYYDMGLLGAWEIHSRGVKIGVVDMFTGHGQRVVDLLHTVSPHSEVSVVAIERYYPELMAAGVSNLVLAGCKVIVFAEGFSYPDGSLFNALVFAGQSNVVVCAAAPNGPGDLDFGLVDYPHNWRLSNVLVVSSVDRSGYPYWSATGTNTVSAPGRNIVAAGTYSSGTSWSCAIVAGCVAILRDRHPGRPAEWYCERLRSTGEQQWKRINLTRTLAPVKNWYLSTPVELKDFIEE